MKFEEIDDDKENMYFNQWQITLPDGSKFIVALWRVLFGFRVVGYYTNGIGPCINWCCGANIPLLVATQQAIKTMIEQGCPIKSLRPFSNIKPWPLDHEFVEYFTSLAKKYNTNAPNVF